MHCTTTLLLLSGLFLGAPAVLAQGPAVSALTPGRNAVSAPVNRPISLTFTQPIAAATANTLRVYGSQLRGLRPGSLQGGGTATLQFTPAQPFMPGERVSVTVPASLTSPAGLKASRQVYQFTAATRGTGRGSFLDTTTVGVTSSRDQLLGDIDNDGDLDLVTTGGLSGAFSYRNDGSGQFKPYVGMLGGVLPRGTALGDFNQDGFLDLLVGDGGNGFIVVALNDRSGQFGILGFPTQRLPLPGTVSSIAVGDVDADGDLDFAVAHAALNAATIGLNDGSGNFTSTGALSMGPQPSAVQLADIDNDGDLDLLTSNESGSSVALRLNEGTGNFGLGPAVAVPVGAGPTDLALVDLNADGYLDLLTANRAAGSISVRFNNAGTFGGGTTLLLPAGSSPTGLATGDVDADGDADVLVAQGARAHVYTYLNGGSGNLILQPNGMLVGGGSSTTAPRSLGVTLGDVDADGDLDLITADAVTGQVLLARNTPQPLVHGFSPGSGVPGSAITIEGTHLQGTQQITFSGPLGTGVSSGFTMNTAGTQLLNVVVPPGAITGPVSVRTAGGTATSTGSFDVPAPLLLVQDNGTTYAPGGAAYNFGAQPTLSTSVITTLTLLNVGAQPLVLSAATATGDFAVVGPIAAMLPPGATTTLPVTFRPTALGMRTGSVVITSNSGGYPSYTLQLEGTGVVPPPVLAGFVPASAQRGYPVALEGTNLTNASAVTFAGTSNNVTTTGFTVNSTGTRITDITVPPGAVTGLATVTTPGGPSAGIQFTVLPPQPPTIISFNPAAAPIGTVVTLTGTNLLGTSYVAFPGASAEYQVINGTTIEVKVPLNATTGPVYLLTPGGASNQLPFSVLPRLTALRPYAASAGKSVTLLGTGLWGITSVQLNGVPATPTTYAGGPAFVVPSGATSGLLTVTTAGGTSNGLPFAVTVPVTLSSVSPRRGAAGTKVTLTGKNLQGATAISFKGVAHNTVVSGFTVSTDGTRITGVVVPSGAATGDILVTTPNGPSSTTFVNFTVDGPATTTAPPWQGLTVSQGGECYVQTCTTDAAGNVYMMGSMAGEATFGSTKLTAHPYGWSTFLTKWSPVSKNFEWAQFVEGSTYTQGQLVVSSNSIYIAGRFFQSTPYRLTLISKYTIEGKLVWQQGLNTNAEIEATALAVQGNSIYIAGNFSSTTSVPSLVLGNTTLRSSGDQDGFVAKLLDAGTTASFAWVLQMGGAQKEEVRSLAVADNALYIGGGLSSHPARFGTLLVNSTLTPANDPTSDGFVAKLLDGGTAPSFSWVRGVSGAGTDVVEELAVQGTNIYVTGQYEHTAQAAPLTLSSPTAYGGVHGFVAKLSDAGSDAAFAWAQPLYTQWERGAVQVNSLVVSDATVYVGGRYHEGARLGTTTLQPGPHNFGCYVARYYDAGSAGTLDWVQVGGGTSYMDSQDVSDLVLSGNTLYAAGHTYRGSPLTTDSVRFPPFAIVVPGRGATAFLTVLPHTPRVVTSSAQQLNAAAVMLYPNPARRQVTVQVPPTSAATPVSIALLDAVGRCVPTRTARASTASGHYQLDLAGLPAGVYHVRVLLNGSPVTKQLLVE